MQISNHFLKLSGKSELPQEVAIGYNYHLSLEGAITSQTDTDNEDGTATRYYKFNPIKIDLLTPKGEALKLKDTRSMSQLFRGRIYGIWSKKTNGIPFEDYYSRLMQRLIQQAQEIDEMFGEDNYYKK